MTASTLLPVTASSRKKLKAAVERYEMQISLELDDWLAGRGLEDGAVSGPQAGESEEWRAIPGFPCYEVSSLGRVRSPRCPDGMTLWEDKDGYPCIRLFRAGKGHVRPVHRLMGEAFFGPRPEGLVTRHLNGDNKDNRLSNLSYGTQAENQFDSVRHGTKPLGDQKPNAKLTWKAVEEIRASPESNQALADRFGVHNVTISQVRLGKRWKGRGSADGSK